MKTDFFWKNIIRCMVFVAVVVAFVFFIFKNNVGGITTLETQKEFYYLASTSTHIEASTHNAQYLGGAGFALEYKDRTYVTYAVYTDSTVAERAFQSLKKQDEDVCVLKIQAKQAKIPRENATAYKNAFHCLYAQIGLFNAEIARLEDGATQESTKRFLTIQQRQFSYMKREYEQSFPKFSTVCQDAVDQMERMKKQTVYVKDMRYLQCFLCDAYARLGG